MDTIFFFWIFEGVALSAAQQMIYTIPPPQFRQYAIKYHFTIQNFARNGLTACGNYGDEIPIRV